MDRMLYVAMAAAKQTMQAQSVSANNLANINTTAFRKDLEASMNVNLNGPGHESRAYSILSGQGFDPTHGSIIQTGNPLDIAINGDGWIAVQANDGSEAYTRAGDLRVTNEGMLVTSGGEPVMGEGGPVTLPPYSSLEIGTDGTISILPVNGDSTALAAVDRLRLVNPPPENLIKGRDGLMRLRDGNNAVADARVQVMSGSLEKSNVNGVEEMVRQIELARRYEAQIRLMSTAKELDRATDQLLRRT